MSERPEEEDARWMRRALDAAQAVGWRTHPNPAVGAVVVREGALLAVGVTEARLGGRHAEVVALEAAGEGARGATLYVTLEPCSHVGRTGPCADAVIRARVARCVVGVSDPDPRVSGRGLAKLREAGVVCVVGVEEGACRESHRAFFTRVTSGRPFVTAKVGMSLDGRIATRTGHSRWITGAAAREEVHRMRDLHDAVLVGTGTLLADDPALTTRLPEGGRQSLRVVLDRELRAPLSHKVFCDGAAPTLLVTSERREAEARGRVGAGVEVLGVREEGGVLSLFALMRALAYREVTTVLCEGGGELIAGLLTAGLVDRYVTFISPKIIGGRTSPGPVGGEGVERVDEGPEMVLEEVRRVGEDLCVVSRPVYEERG